MDEEGRPLENVEIRFYLSDNPTQEADIFTHPELGTSTYTSVANIKTNGNGFFQFWVGDEFETLAGYSSEQKFRLVWQRAGILLGSINNIDIFPPLFQVDEEDGSSSTTNEKNKTVSNYLAYLWTTHTNSTFANEEPPHNVLPVDITKTDGTVNKLVSNNLMNYILSAISSAGTLSIESTAAIERNFIISSWTPTGSDYYANVNHFIGREYPIVQMHFYTGTNTGFAYQPKKVVSLNENSLRIHVAEDTPTALTLVG